MPLERRSPRPGGKVDAKTSQTVCSGDGMACGMVIGNAVAHEHDVGVRQERSCQRSGGRDPRPRPRKPWRWRSYLVGRGWQIGHPEFFAGKLSQQRGLRRRDDVTTTRVIWDVVVVGGGLAGLAAGVEVTAAGGRALVIEGHQPGGRARVTERDGFIFNHGGHALYMGGPGLGVLRRHGIEPEGAKPPLRRYKMSREGRHHRFPCGPDTLLRTTILGARAKVQVGRLLAGLPRVDAARLAGTSVSAWLGDLGLRPDAEAVVRAVVRQGTYSSDQDDLDAGAAVNQLQLAVSDGVSYLHGGWAQLVEGLACRTQVRAGCKVRSLTPVAAGIEVTTDAGPLTARAVVVAAGTPEAARSLLPDPPDWGDLGPPVTAACLDLGLDRIPSPGWVLGVDEPLYATLQSPPAHMAPPGGAVAALIRYGARNATADRADLEAHARLAGIDPEAAAVSRFLARMVVAGAQPRARLGGLAGRPAVTATGHRAIAVCGDWVGPEGMLADAALASGAAAGRAALDAARSATLAA